MCLRPGSNDRVIIIVAGIPYGMKRGEFFFFVFDIEEFQIFTENHVFSNVYFADNSPYKIY